MCVDNTTDFNMQISADDTKIYMYCSYSGFQSCYIWAQCYHNHNSWNYSNKEIYINITCLWYKIATIYSSLVILSFS